MSDLRGALGLNLEHGEERLQQHEVFVAAARGNSSRRQRHPRRTAATGQGRRHDVAAPQGMRETAPPLGMGVLRPTIQWRQRHRPAFRASVRLTPGAYGSPGLFGRARRRQAHGLNGPGPLGARWRELTFVRRRPAPDWRRPYAGATMDAPTPRWRRRHALKHPRHAGGDITPLLRSTHAMVAEISRRCYDAPTPCWRRCRTLLRQIATSMADRCPRRPPSPPLVRQCVRECRSAALLVRHFIMCFHEYRLDCPATRPRRWRVQYICDTPSWRGMCDHAPRPIRRFRRCDTTPPRKGAANGE